MTLNHFWRFCSIISLTMLMFSAPSFAHEAEQQTAQNKPETTLMQSTQLNISPLVPDVYLHQSYKQVSGFGLVESNGLVVVQDKQAFIIDTPWTDSDTAKLVDWITLQGLTTVASISTHSHEDRAGGVGYLNSKGIATWVSNDTQAILTANRLSTATHTFVDNKHILQPQLIEVYYLGAGHTVDNLVVGLPKQQILFGGCLIKSLNSRTLGYTGEADLKQWPVTVAKVQAQFTEAKMVVPGHGKIGNTSLLSHTIELLSRESHVNTDLKIQH
ncbi:DIM/SIM/IMP family subclass B1 metallo-beta-lactamase [Shewanella ulleungensis]|uniref:beta-lactamase n=1 Tax=Shewanella ulleungensis TaxID=2282699 RepID=A0ABQ2QMS5_9GAMM|nr:DIM/SIM/IMP family subclass B1 metallo-beta-lactamase [Shewanella ulleungensis]MCL1150044.1 DIM/SIM/IMP family subclass B1 metallo-beta-lactamase [Shewanella ulleungensis]GGP86351.1 beta-lactamase [Shewanella ulleungensis]